MKKFALQRSEIGLLKLQLRSPLFVDGDHHSVQRAALLSVAWKRADQDQQWLISMLFD